MTNDPIATVRPVDVLILSVPAPMKSDAKQAYLEWFRGSLVGTSLEHCRIVLLDAGADVKIFRGADITA